METRNPPAPFDVTAIRQDFPILRGRIHGKPLVYLDNGATTQKPQVVIDAISSFYSLGNANIHRGVHYLSVAATDAYDKARETIARYLNASATSEVIFTRGTTESVNLVARSFLRPRLQPGDEILVTEMEHHANIVPWQMVAQETGARVRACPITPDGEIDESAFSSLLGERTAMVAFMHVSNVLGTINPVERLVAMAKARGIPVLVDGAQAVPHFAVDVRATGADFYAFSGHKLYGPTGIGVLWARGGHLDRMPPFLGGGDMIASVTFERSEWAAAPAKFEAGTPPIIEAVGLHAAIDYVGAIGMPAIEAHERALVDHATARLAEVPGLTLLGRAQDRGGVFAFALDAAHPHDLATLLDRAGIAVRAGRHCAEPLHARFGLENGTTRASFGLYTTKDEVDLLAQALTEAREFFK
jgi:cysteine desulfurase/selenocysteine lyase